MSAWVRNRRIGYLLAALVVAAPVPRTAPAQTVRSSDPATRLAAAAVERTTHAVVYDGSYRRIGYPGGDVPGDVGVCTDLVVRSYRAVGIDLQREVHEDMRADFSAYPTIWGLSRPDPNIDHRRVPNLRTFFARKGRSLAVTPDAAAYRAGDVVTWMLPGNLPHIGIVVDGLSAHGDRPLVAHNIGNGPEVEDMLFDYRITGHYRYPAR